MSYFVSIFFVRSKNPEKLYFAGTAFSFQKLSYRNFPVHLSLCLVSTSAAWSWQDALDAFGQSGESCCGGKAEPGVRSCFPVKFINSQGQEVSSKGTKFWASDIPELALALRLSAGQGGQEEMYSWNSAPFSERGLTTSR